jgi:hypothetical protein
MGNENYMKKWPSPYAIACGLLLSLSFLKYVYHPLQWLAVGAVAFGIYPITLKGIVAIRNLRLDINILVIIAGKSFFYFVFFSLTKIYPIYMSLGTTLTLRKNKNKIIHDGWNLEPT